MTIESYDVEPVDDRVLFRWLLGLVATLCGTAAVVGWPLPVLSGRYLWNHAWSQNVHLVTAWLQYDGWRTSAASWFWGGAAIAATAFAISMRAGRPPARHRLLIVLPGAVVAVIGPLVWILVRAPWSNYADGVLPLPTAIVYVVCLAVALGFPAFRDWATRDGREKAQRSQ